ncbi:MAG: hypothetical protein GY795_49935 [Desulfobacterales bacterium]|nr:hypothetical protein [Desulfobacterales bacterium]
MSKKSLKLFFIIVVAAGINITAANATDWVSISGGVKTEDGTSLCAMVLANGQHMFTCNPVGEYKLSVPLDENGQITLYVFCEGFMPFKQVLNRWEDQFDISMPIYECTPDDCENIEGTWSESLNGTMSVTILGETISESLDSSETVSVEQDNCNTEWNFITETNDNFKRTGTVKGNIVSLSGEVVNAAALEREMEDNLKQQGISATVVFYSNTHNGEGIISGDNISYKGTGYMLGTVTYMGESPFSIYIYLAENSILTTNKSRRNTLDKGAEEDIFFQTHFLADFLTEMLGSIFD